jgi:hypothetical protein
MNMENFGLNPKSGGPRACGPPYYLKVEGSRPRDPHGIAVHASETKDIKLNIWLKLTSRFSFFFIIWSDLLAVADPRFCNGVWKKCSFPFSSFLPRLFRHFLFSAIVCRFFAPPPSPFSPFFLLLFPTSLSTSPSAFIHSQPSHSLLDLLSRPSPSSSYWRASGGIYIPGKIFGITEARMCILAHLPSEWMTATRPI